MCTIYPRENYFTVLVVVGKKEKDTVKAILQEFNPILRDIYCQTKDGNGQRWLMIDLEDMVLHTVEEEMKKGTHYKDIYQLCKKNGEQIMRFAYLPKFAEKAS